jgi:hypothetical protein
MDAEKGAGRPGQLEGAISNVRGLKYACIREEGWRKELSNQRQSAKNVNANAHLHHEIKIDDDPNGVAFPHEASCYKNC